MAVYQRYKQRQLAMAKGRKTGGRDFKPGQSGNLNGRPPVPEVLRAVRDRNRAFVEGVLQESLFLPVEEIRTRVKGGKIGAIEAMLYEVLLTAINTGDPRRAEFLLTRLIGRPPSDQIELGFSLPDPASGNFPPGYINKIIVRFLSEFGEDEQNELAKSFP